MTHWLTSDTHYGHVNILNYSNRPFKSIEEHDEALIANWNAVVEPDDLVYHLGDFALCDEDRAIKIAKRLMGNKFLVFGNHDKRLRKNKEFLAQWQWTGDLKQIEVEGQKIILMHYALLTWNQSHRGSWQLYGHSHGSLKEDPHALRTDVGVDVHGYYPVSFEDIKKLMSKKSFVPIDHHDSPGRYRND